MELHKISLWTTINNLENITGHRTTINTTYDGGINYKVHVNKRTSVDNKVKIGRRRETKKKGEKEAKRERRSIRKK